MALDFHGVIARLGPHYDRVPAVTPDSLPEFVHQPSKTQWVLIPGGRFSMGLSAAEEAAARRISDPPPMSLDQMAKAASGFMPTRALDKAEQAEMVRHAVSNLNERQRMALLLAKFEGMSYQDIAQTMDLSVQAIKSLLSRARVNLKEMLTPYVESGTPPEEETKNQEPKNQEPKVN